VADEVTDLGGTVGYRNDKVGYVRAVVPTRAVERTAKLPGVYGVDLNERLRVPDPRPERAGASARPGATAVAGPGPGTPAENPYLPTNEIGATDFVRANPEWDGRGVTIGVLDSGVDLDHPSLQTTSTGERKIVDWFTATDPLVDGDRSWRPMLTKVTGPEFRYDDRDWTAPSGTFFVNEFEESVTEGDEYGGDVNRDGDSTDTWGVLYRPDTNDIWVDTDDDHQFTDEELRRPYREKFQVGHFGLDKTDTPVQESVPFVVEFREDVDLTPVGHPWPVH
jgi:subtilisin family serine protease